MEQGKVGSFFVHTEGSVRDIAKKVVGTQEEDNAFYVCDLRQLKTLVQFWQKELPRVVPYYAIKANPDPVIVKTLQEEGFNFDCSNKREIQLVLNSGVDPKRIIYANPAKQASHLDYAEGVGVTLMTFDCVMELHKINDKNARLLFRFAMGGQRPQEIKVERKFGCRLADAEEVLRAAMNLGHAVVGVAFHLGCVSCMAETYQVAIEQARKLFDLGAHLGIEMSVLDIGGGFFGSIRKLDQLAQVFAGVRSALDLYFPPSCGTVVIAEPGEFFVTSLYTLAVKIVAKRTRLSTTNGRVRKQHDVYVNESRENSVPRDMYKFLDIAYSPLSPPYERPRNQLTNLWGATCHTLDVIEDGVLFFDVSVGEWLLMDNAGAYGMAEACGFNGFGFPPVHYRTEREDVQRVSGILQASELSPGYSQPEAALRNAPTLMEEP
ncbi:ornithine decarboxylase 1-like [Haemaphysalis longicornis]